MHFSAFRLLSILILLGIVAACGFVGGAANSIDIGLLRDGIALRAASPAATDVGRVLNVVGGAEATIGAALGAAMVLWLRRRRHAAAAMTAMIIGGRLLIEAVKYGVHRTRPALDAHPVVVRSLSFPSAHAGNSMVAFCALALFLAPVGRRTTALLAAVLASLIVGCSRPLLGVHYPSDVVAGWSLAGAWLLATWPFARRLLAREPEHDVVGGHRHPPLQD